MKKILLCDSPRYSSMASFSTLLTLLSLSLVSGKSLTSQSSSLSFLSLILSILCKSWDLSSSVAWLSDCGLYGAISHCCSLGWIDLYFAGFCCFLGGVVSCTGAACSLGMATLLVVGAPAFVSFNGIVIGYNTSWVLTKLKISLCGPSQKKRC